VAKTRSSLGWPSPLHPATNEKIRRNALLLFPEALKYARMPLLFPGCNCCPLRTSSFGTFLIHPKEKPCRPETCCQDTFVQQRKKSKNLAIQPRDAKGGQCQCNAHLPSLFEQRQLKTKWEVVWRCLGRISHVIAQDAAPRWSFIDFKTLSLRGD